TSWLANCNPTYNNSPNSFLHPKSPISFLIVSSPPCRRMFGSQLLRSRYPVSGLGSVTDHPRLIHRIPNSLANCFCQFPFRNLSTFVNCYKLKPIIVTGQHSHGSFGPKSRYSHGSEYLEASLLISETVRHYRLRERGFQEDVNWQPNDPYLPLSQAKDISTDSSSLGLEFLHLFHSPTIFLKISCEGEFLLPIAVGEFAVKKLIDSLQEDIQSDCPNQFQFARNCVSELGYQVKMVKITERVGNIYHARIYFSKVGVKESFNIDARPSDAINLARRCKVPIYVNKQVFLTDAIRISYRRGRVHDAKPCYDVLLDSASEEPELLSEELDVVNNLNLAIQEERYLDAVSKFHSCHISVLSKEYEHPSGFLHLQQVSSNGLV
ncbi:hypothetical protein V2J09_009876, partial [Rumex salicifolius]